MNKNIVKQFFPNEVKLVEQKICPTCAKPVDFLLFKEEIDRREYRISGICKPCQDKIFG
jgi:hypothetical protein